MKKFLMALAIVIALLSLAQLIRPEKIVQGKPLVALNSVPNEVTEILKNACFDCHSSYSNLRWYDNITPFNYLVAKDIINGRSALNFSDWDKLPKQKQTATIYYSINKILSGEMPLPAYKTIHPSSKLNNQQLEILKNYALLGTPEMKDVRNIERTGKDAVTPMQMKNISPAPNGITYIPGYRNWKAINISERFDNGSMRIIYGNDIAVKAEQSGHTNPWPQGTVLAKAAWKQQKTNDGIIIPGEFIQVEFMIRDEKKFKSTGGWGWARWRGGDLKPYGKKGFEQECITCHRPVKNNDQVFTIPLYLGNISSQYIK